MVSWITDSALSSAIHILRQRAESAIEGAETRRRRNVVDPFSSLVVASTFGIEDGASLARIQRLESAMRGISNALGEFHQRVLGSVEGWANHDAGYDLECEQLQIVAEIKNKWNTMNATNRRQVESGLGEAVRQKRGSWLGYLVIIIPKTPVRYEHPIAGQRNVFEIDGVSFYHKITGYKNALHDLFDYACEFIAPSDSVADYCHAVVNNSLPPRA